MILHSRYLALLLIILFIASGAMQQLLDSRTNFNANKNVFLSLPSAKFLKIATFGYRNLLADAIFIWAIQFYSTYYLQNRFDYIERIFNAITDITPKYKEPYLIGAMIMAIEKFDVPMALRLLDKGAQAMPNEWIFDNDAAFYAYKYLKDLKQAEALYARAASKPAAPEYLRRHEAHVIYLENNLDQAYAMWLSLYQNAQDQLERDSARNHLYQIKYEKDRDMLAEKIKQFQESKGRPPRTLSELVSKGFITAVPRDFIGKDYIYDPNTAQISAVRRFRWK